jgi:hypothetical protein
VEDKCLARCDHTFELLQSLQALGQFPELAGLSLLLYGPDEGVVELVRHGCPATVCGAVKDFGSEVLYPLLQLPELPVALAPTAPRGVALSLIGTVRVVGVTVALPRTNHHSTPATIPLNTGALGHQLRTPLPLKAPPDLCRGPARVARVGAIMPLEERRGMEYKNEALEAIVGNMALVHMDLAGLRGEGRGTTTGGRELLAYDSVGVTLGIPSDRVLKRLYKGPEFVPWSAILSISLKSGGK